MSRQFLFFLLLLLCLINFDSQAQKVFRSRPSEFGVLSNDYGILGRSGNNIDIYRSSLKQEMFLERLNDSMQLNKLVALDFIPKESFNVQLFKTGAGITAFFQIDYKGYVFLHSINLDTEARPLGNPTILDSVKNDWFAPGKNYFSFIQSPDKNKLMALGIGGNDVSKIKAILIEKGVPVSNKLVAISFFDGQPEQTILDDEGNFYMTIKRYSDEVGEYTLYDPYILYLGTDSEEIARIQLPVRHNFLTTLLIKDNYGTGKIQLGGLTASGKRSKVDSVLIGCIDIKGSLGMKVQLMPIDNRVVQKKSGKYDKNMLNDYQVKDLITKRNNGLIVINEKEEHHANIRYLGSNASKNIPLYQYYEQEYLYGDILVMSYDSSGKLEWHSFIRKEQATLGDDGTFSSFGMVNTGAALVFIFNQFEKGALRPSIAVLDEHGQLQMQKLGKDTFKGKCTLRYGQQISSREFITPVIDDKTLSFFKIAL